jgi:hypothetical protein
VTTTREPVCPLCSGALSCESDVCIQTGGANTLAYSLAWVCKQCSATWPIGQKSGGLFKGWKPAWWNGKKAE